jgi:hypothetical protein
MSESDSEPAATILMWGDSATGKSSLIAAALFDDPHQLEGIDLARTGEEAAAARLNEHWRDLREGRLRAGTVQERVDIRLHRTHGAPILLRDVRGDLIDQSADVNIVRGILQPANVVLFVMDFQAADPTRQLRAIDVWTICDKAAKGLIFTKCELNLDYDHRAWKGGSNWWREFPELRMRSRFIERFGDAVFPTSVFGYHHGSKFPALTLGEFGEVRPFGISPRGVIAPFAWAIERATAR